MPEMTKQRPKYLALHEIRLPLAGFASILHRVSGAGIVGFELLHSGSGKKNRRIIGHKRTGRHYFVSA